MSPDPSTVSYKPTNFQLSIFNDHVWYTAIFNIHDGAQALRKQALLMSKRIRHRGPDWSGIYQGKTAILAHERLSIVDPASGGQPLVSPDGKLILCVNGEIYNHQELRER